MRLFAVAVVVAFTCGISAQVPAPASFDAASVKPADDHPAPPLVVLQAGGRLYAPRATLKELVRVAYGVEQDQLIGGPSWLDRDTFELIANTTPTASMDDVRAMLRALLKERFQLTAHEDTRDLPVYVLERSDKPGPGLRRANEQCAPMRMPAGLPAPPPPPPPPGGAPSPRVLGAAPGVGSRCGALFLNGWAMARDASMPWFVYQLGRTVHRRVVDRTGLTGNFDIDLVYTPDDGPATLNGQSISGDAPVLSTAVREQLGLKLTSTKASLPVVVIDRAEHPTEN